MLQIRDHGVEDYAALLDMDATDVGVMTEDDRACLDELGEYLVTTESWQRFAVWLLHKHFEPADGGILRRTRHFPNTRRSKPLWSNGQCFLRMG